MKTTMKALVLGLATTIALPAAAEPTVLTIGSGSETGTYYPIVQQIADVCNSSTLTIQHRLDAEGKSIGGSDNNLRGILRNEIPAGLAQLDKAYLELQVNPDMPRVQAVLPLHEEAIHVMVPTEVMVLKEPAVEPNWLGLGGKEAVYAPGPNTLRSIDDLEGATIASWGGSLTSAKIISQLGRLDFNIVEVGGSDEALAMLLDGKARALISTVGYPAAWIEQLPDGKFKLLEVSEGLAEDVDAVYGLTGVSYDNLSVGGQSLQTLAVDALLFAWEYKSEKFVNALAELQACVRENIVKFQEDPGMHPAWRRIDPSREMKWENVFVAPASATTTLAPAEAN